MDALKQKLNAFRQKPVLIFSMGCLFLFALCIFFVYSLRVVYSPAWMGQAKWTGIVFAAAVILCGAWLMGRKLRDKNMPLAMAFLLLVLGCVYTFATPPNQVPDENTHYLRGYQMAQGQWGFDQYHQFPDDVNILMDTFHTAHNNGYPAKVGNTVYNRFVEYYDKLASGAKADNMGIIIFQVIPYIPLAIGIMLAKAVGMGALGAYYAGRLRNVVFFCICAYFALKMRERFRVIMFCLMAMPLMTFVYASCNSDAVLFGLMFLMFGALLSDRFDITRFTVYVVSLAVLTTCKRSYIVFILMLFAIDKDSWAVTFRDKKVGRLVSLAVSLLVLAVIYVGMGAYVSAFSNYGVIERTMRNTDAGAQLMFIIANPLRYAAVVLDTLYNNAFFLFSGGLLGWLDVHLPLINYLTPVVAILCCVKQASAFNSQDTRKVLYFLLCSLLTYGVVITGLYLSWTPVTLPQVIGLQMRYFYPAFMGFCLGMGMYFSTKVSAPAHKSDISCIATSYWFSVLAAVLMLIVYYLPRKAVVFVA